MHSLTHPESFILMQLKEWEEEIFLPHSGENSLRKGVWKKAGLGNGTRKN